MSGPRPPGRGESQEGSGWEGSGWPESDLGRRVGPADQPPAGSAEGFPTDSPPLERAPDDRLPAEEGPVDTRWDPSWGERRQPTTAEQAVPWLIGIILLLTGIVIVLVVLIFTMEGGGVAASTSPSPSPSPVPVATSTPAATATPIPPSASPDAPASASPDASATPAPSFGELALVYLARSSPLGASGAYRRDFSVAGDAETVASSSQGIDRLVWARDGSVGAVITGGDRLLAVEDGSEPRALADGIDAATFGPDAATIYAARVTTSGSTDTAVILAIDFESGAAEEVASISFPHPATFPEAPLKEAQFGDEGGHHRLFLLDDASLVFWELAAGTWQIDPSDGSFEAVGGTPILWSPDGSRRIQLTENVTSTTMAVIDREGRAGAQVTVVGLVSHLRWSPDGETVVFTRGQSGASGGVRQDLFVWEVDGGASPRGLTSNGASYGAEWLGTRQFWSR